MERPLDRPTGDVTSGRRGTEPERVSMVVPLDRATGVPGAAECWLREPCSSTSDLALDLSTLTTERMGKTRSLTSVAAEGKPTKESEVVLGDMAGSRPESEGAWVRSRSRLRGSDGWCWRRLAGLSDWCSREPSALGLLILRTRPMARLQQNVAKKKCECHARGRRLEKKNR